MKRFILLRHKDTSGISGTGVVAEGVRFTNGMCAMTWLTEYTSYNLYPSISYIEAVHGHNGQTEVVWLDI
jgi:hypothetical protein